MRLESLETFHMTIQRIRKRFIDVAFKWDHHQKANVSQVPDSQLFWLVIGRIALDWEWWWLPVAIVTIYFLKQLQVSLKMHHAWFRVGYCNVIIRTVFNWVSKVISRLLWFALLAVWLVIKLAPFSKPMRNNQNQLRLAHMLHFPVFFTVTCIFFWLFYCAVYFCCDWPE